MIDAHEIVTGLWMGAVPPRGRELCDIGFKTLVLCAKEWQFGYDTFEGVTVIRCPLEDATLDARDVMAAKATATLVAREIKANRKVLVSCASGMNRSGLVTALALRELGSSSKDAIKTIRARRCDAARLALRPLCNESFVSVLLALDNTVVTDQNV